VGTWDRFYDPLKNGGDDVVTDGDVAAEDILCGRIYEYLSANAKLSEIFEGRIEIKETRPRFDFSTFPRLQIYASSTSETERPTNVDVNEVRIFVNVRFDALNVETVQPYHATLASVRKTIATELKKRQALLVATPGNPTVRLSHDLTPGFTVWIWDLSADEDRVAGNMETEWIYRVDVDRDSQRILTLKSELG